MGVLDVADFGQTLGSAAVETGLRELNSEISFDLGARTNQWHPYIDTRQGVYYRETHICSMDRGVIPEFKIWETKKRIVQLPWSASDHPDSSIRYEVVYPTEPNYGDLYQIGLSGADPEYMVRKDGSLVKCKVYGYETSAKRCVRVGWRHTFERILAAQIPGVTRARIAEKFRVNMDLIPTGTHEELVEALVAE